ncbi:MAG TPA: hypothetical protein DGG95_09180 [Cytophagales bacterium]|jgi:hypothetical protein|nr:hypothetical protein [Cytophagales bacterium]
MNFKYFGNALDLFKFDLITYLCEHGTEKLFYVPMITEPQPKEYDPKYFTYELGSKNELLYHFLKSKFEQKEKSEIEEIKSYFQKRNLKYTWFSPNGNSNGFFKDETRTDYFTKVASECKIIGAKKFIYCDPDIGSDIGVVRRFRSKRDMYLRGEDVLKIKNQTTTNDYIGFFQHLGNTNYSPAKRISDLKKHFGKWILLVGYSRIQASLVLVFNNENEFEDKREKIKRYFKLYEYLEHSEKFVLK